MMFPQNPGESIYLIKHDFEVTKSSGKIVRLTELEYWDRGFQISDLLVQKKERETAQPLLIFF